MARRRLPLPPKLVDTVAVHPAQGIVPALPQVPQRRTRHERRVVAAIALMQLAGGARRRLAGAAATAFFVIGLMLIFFPIITSTVLAVGTLVTSVWLAGFALARRRGRRWAAVARGPVRARSAASSASGCAPR